MLSMLVSSSEYFLDRRAASRSGQQDNVPWPCNPLILSSPKMVKMQWSTLVALFSVPSVRSGGAFRWRAPLRGWVGLQMLRTLRPGAATQPATRVGAQPRKRTAGGEGAEPRLRHWAAGIGCLSPQARPPSLGARAPPTPGLGSRAVAAPPPRPLVPTSPTKQPSAARGSMPLLPRAGAGLARDATERHWGRSPRRGAGTCSPRLRARHRTRAGAERGYHAPANARPRASALHFKGHFPPAGALPASSFSPEKS